MKCPACSSEMTTEDFDGVSVDVCRDGCKGIWLDWMEMCRLEHDNQPLNAAVQEAFAWPRKNDDNRGPLNCPKCNEPMHQHLAEDDKGVKLDECYDCGGFFLDSGEMKDIHDHKMSEDEQQAYADKLMDGVPEFKQAQLDLEQQRARTQAIAHWTRFLRLGWSWPALGF